MRDPKHPELLVPTPGGGLAPASQMSQAIAYEQAHGIERQPIGRMHPTIPGPVVFTGVNPFTVRFRLRDRFDEAGRVARGAKLCDAWNAMIEWFAEQASVRAMLAQLGVDMSEDD